MRDAIHGESVEPDLFWHDGSLGLSLENGWAIMPEARSPPRKGEESRRYRSSFICDSLAERGMALPSAGRGHLMSKIRPLDPLWQMVFAGRRLQHDLALHQRIDSVGGAKRFFEQLLDQQHRGALRAQLADDVEHPVDQHWRQA